MLGSWESPALMRAPWLEADVASMTARMAARPDIDSLPFPAAPQLVVEYYAQRL